MLWALFPLACRGGRESSRLPTVELNDTVFSPAGG
jgi:hypothetical protein